MFNNASSANRVVSTALSVTYSIDKQNDNGTIWYKVTRKATKDYKFVDLTEKAANLAVTAKVAMYTRTTRICISRTTDKSFANLTSDIKCQANACGSWDVVIKVQEEDSTHSATIPSDPASLFTTENQRNYDEADNGISIVSNSYWEDWEPPTYLLRIDVTATVSGALSANDVHFYCKYAHEDEWGELSQTITVEGNTARCIYEILDYSHPDTLLKAVCVDYESNIETVSY